MRWGNWDDNDLNKGLWLCFRCHMFAEGVDCGCNLEKYLVLKDTVEKGGVNNAKLLEPYTMPVST